MSRDITRLWDWITDDTGSENSPPNISSGGSCPNGDDDDFNVKKDDSKTLQSRGRTIKKRTADAFGKSKREVGRALESIKREHQLGNDFHETIIKESGNVFNKNTGG